MPSLVRMAPSALEYDVRRRALKARMFGIDETPLRIGRYPVERMLGEGAMGVVLLARDERLDRPVAIKLLRARLTTGEARLEREARALARLSHPHVVTVHEVGEHEGQLFFVMEYVRGETLRRWMAQPRPAEERLAIMRQAAEGLEAAHRIGLVHRDFKPENAIVGEDGRLRIVDFGLATSPTEADTTPSEPTAVEVPWSRVTVTGARLGTPAYMAPEMLAGAVPSEATDRYAWCCVAWEVLFGEHPRHPREDEHQAGADKLGGLGRARRVLQRGLAEDPMLRPEGWAPLVDALRPTRRGVLLAGGVAGLGLLAVLAVSSLDKTEPPASTSSTPASVLPAVEIPSPSPTLASPPAPSTPTVVATCSETPGFDLPRTTLESNRRGSEEELQQLEPGSPAHRNRRVWLAGWVLALGDWALACESMAAVLEEEPDHRIGACWHARYCDDMESLPWRTRCFGGHVDSCMKESIKHKFEYLDAKRTAEETGDETLRRSAMVHHAYLLEVLRIACDQGHAPACEKWERESKR